MEKKEKDCVLLCGVILKKLLESKITSKGFAYQVLEKKIQRASYNHFIEIYRDMKIAATPKKQKGLRNKVMTTLARRESGLVRLFFFICTIVIIVAVASLISHLLFGDVPWLRIIFNGFKEIGTESLLQ